LYGRRPTGSAVYGRDPGEAPPPERTSDHPRDLVQQIAEIWIFEANQYEVDALFGGALTDP
jgi:hypothetical protein